MTSKNSLLGIQRCAALIFLLAIAPGIGLAQTNAPAVTPATLPPAAQEALEKGIIAARVPDYLLAIRYFDEARKLAPQAPVVYLNMGLAESRIPGRELRAMAWFGAYLAAYPDAPNAAAVKEQIGTLAVRNQSNFSRLIKLAQDALPKVKPHPLGWELPPLPADNTGRLASIAELWARSGDMTTALKVADLIRNDDVRWKSIAQGMVASVQAENDDIAGAQLTTALIETSKVKFEAQSQIAKAQARSGDFASAQKTADLIQGPDKESALTAIAKAKAKAGIVTRPLTAYDWLSKLDDKTSHRLNSGDFMIHHSAWNTAPFLDLAGFLKSLPPSGNPEDVYESIFRVASLMVGAQNIITGMLKQQAKQ